MPSVLMPLYGRAARPTILDMTPILTRPVVGLTPQVRNSFTTHVSPIDPSIGTVGWSFVQHGLRYACSYKDDHDNDRIKFSVTVAKDQPYLHQLDTMCIAEKAHVLAVVQNCVNPNSLPFLRRYLGELEKACSDPDKGHVVREIQHGPLLRSVDGLKAHVGLIFPADDNYTSSPDLAVFCLQWVRDHTHYMIDCSSWYPLFTVGSAHTPAVQRKVMTNAQAKGAITYAKTLAVRDPDLQMLSGVTHLWKQLEVFAENLPDFSTPAP